MMYVITYFIQGTYERPEKSQRSNKSKESRWQKIYAIEVDVRG